MAVVLYVAPAASAGKPIEPHADSARHNGYCWPHTPQADRRGSAGALFAKHSVQPGTGCRKAPGHPLDMRLTETRAQMKAELADTQRRTLEARAQGTHAFEERTKVLYTRLPWPQQPRLHADARALSWPG